MQAPAPSPGDVRRTVRTDESAWREDSGFEGPTDEQLLTFTYLPAAGGDRALVICPSLYQDSFGTYRQEVSLARRLARSGVAVGRLHYRGTGNSDDLRGAAPTLDSMVRDVQALEARLQATGVSRFAFLGVGYGSLVAAQAARRHESSPLVLWQPIATGRQYFKELFRAGRLADARVTDPDARVASRTQLLAEHGWVEVLGQRIERVSYDDAEGLDLCDLLGQEPRRVMVVQVGSAGRVSAADTLSSRFGEMGLHVDRLDIDNSRSWWFVAGEWEPDGETPEFASLSDSVTAWVSAEEVW